MTAEDLVIADLAASEAELADRVVVLQHENTVLREMVSEGLRLLAREQAHLEMARRSIHALRWQPASTPVIRPAA